MKNIITHSHTHIHTKSLSIQSTTPNIKKLSFYLSSMLIFFFVFWHIGLRSSWCSALSRQVLYLRVRKRCDQSEGKVWSTLAVYNVLRARVDNLRPETKLLLDRPNTLHSHVIHSSVFVWHFQECHGFPPQLSQIPFRIRANSEWMLLFQISLRSHPRWCG